MVLVDVDVDLEALGRRGVEKGCDLAPPTGLVLLHGKHEVGPVARDRVRDGGITSDGVDGHERARERAGGVPGGVVVTALLNRAWFESGSSRGLGLLCPVPI